VQTLKEALRLLREPQIAYRKADVRVRRLFSQALFETVILHDDEIAGASPTAWVTEIHQLAGSPLSRRGLSRSTAGPALGGHGFNKAEMVRLVEQLSNPSPSLRVVLRRDRNAGVKARHARED
jgi:hypothetical protein